MGRSWVKKMFISTCSHFKWRETWCITKYRFSVTSSKFFKAFIEYFTIPIQRNKNEREDKLFIFNIKSVRNKKKISKNHQFFFVIKKATININRTSTTESIPINYSLFIDVRSIVIKLSIF